MANPEWQAVVLLVPVAKFGNKELKQCNDPGVCAYELPQEVHINQPVVDDRCLIGGLNFLEVAICEGFKGEACPRDWLDALNLAGRTKGQGDIFRVVAEVSVDAKNALLQAKAEGFLDSCKLQDVFLPKLVGDTRQYLKQQRDRAYCSLLFNLLLKQGYRKKL